MWDQKSNLVLIGMPSSGKSTLGRALADRLGLNFVDTDRLIEQSEQCTLQQLVSRYGVRRLRAVEQRINAGLDLQNHVISTGGSVIYSDVAMQNLARIGCVVYLKLALGTVMRRLQNSNSRGLARQPNQSIPELYHQRIPLYESWAERTVNNDLPLTQLRLDQILMQLTPDSEPGQPDCGNGNDQY